MKGPNKVLFIDDEDQNITFFEKVLKAAGYDVTIARTCEEGLEKARVAQYDIIVTDFNTKSKMDGIQMCQHLRDDPKTTEIPIVVITGHLRSELKIPPHIELSLTAVLEKPFHYRHLLETVQVALKEMPPVAI